MKRISAPVATLAAGLIIISGASTQASAATRGTAPAQQVQQVQHQPQAQYVIHDATFIHHMNGGPDAAPVQRQFTVRPATFIHHMDAPGPDATTPAAQAQPTLTA
ncbi:hypothetical protein GCM10009839_12710 [Catenulispora yoronensis]|uniref:Uncharacterized protein n=1 Tax=Catenulispora yoronensis TaxID=450799 RepID=A0ABP5F9A0_9ACTN